MSTSTSRHEYTCEWCGDPRPADQAHCSDACYYKDKGAGVLSYITHDHTVCSTCFRPLKTVYRPDAPGRGLQRKPWKDGSYPARRPASKTAGDFIGWQRLTNNTQRAERGYDAAEGHPTLVYAVESGCECGATDHRDAHGFIRDDIEDADAVADRLFAQLTDLHAKGTIDTEPDRDRFDAGWADGGPALAVGKACYQG